MRLRAPDRRTRRRDDRIAPRELDWILEVPFDLQRRIFTMRSPILTTKTPKLH